MVLGFEGKGYVLDFYYKCSKCGGTGKLMVKCSCKDGGTCSSAVNTLYDHLGCADCDALTIDEQEALANMFDNAPCDSCKHRAVRGTTCWECKTGWDNWEPLE